MNSACPETRGADPRDQVDVSIFIIAVKSIAVLRTLARCSAAAAFVVGVTGLGAYLCASARSTQEVGALATIELGLVASTTSMVACLVCWILEPAVGTDARRPIRPAIWLNLAYLAMGVLFATL